MIKQQTGYLRSLMFCDIMKANKGEVYDNNSSG